MRKHLILKTFTGADLASSDLDKADFTCIMTGGFDKHGHLFLLEKFKKRGVETTEILREVFRQMLFYKSSRGFIEKNRYESIMKTCKKLVKRGFYGDPFEIKKLVNKIQLIPHYTNKQDRLIDNVQPMHRSKSLWFPRNWTDVTEFFLLYPAVEHDDIGDVIEMLISHGSTPSMDFTDYVPAGNDVLYNRNAMAANRTVQRAAMKYNIWTGRRKRE